VRLWFGLALYLALFFVLMALVDRLASRAPGDRGEKDA
jgi:hypothetical protein